MPKPVAFRCPHRIRNRSFLCGCRPGPGALAQPAVRFAISPPRGFSDLEGFEGDASPGTLGVKEWSQLHMVQGGCPHPRAQKLWSALPGEALLSPVDRTSWQRQAFRALSDRDLSPFEARRRQGWEQGDQVGQRWPSEEDWPFEDFTKSLLPGSLSEWRPTPLVMDALFMDTQCRPPIPSLPLEEPGDSWWVKAGGLARGATTHHVCNLDHITWCC